VSEIILENNVGGFFEEICNETYKQMRKHSEEKVLLEVILFDFNGQILARKF
jgi:cobalt-precorrin-5B (C1)-methyltransferase